MSDRAGNFDPQDEHLVLRVFFAPWPRDFPLRDGLRIGATIACDICIDHPDVIPRHALLTRQQGQWRIECPHSGRLILLDGSEFRELPLYEGTTFRIGPTVMRCVAPEAAESRDVPEVTAPQRADEPPAALSAIQCTRCNSLIAHLPGEAKFCPRCGQALPQRAGVLSGDGRSVRSLLDLLLPLLDATLPNRLRHRMDRVDPDRPRTLLAYINTLVRLGIRYELGDGTSKNVGQALRYYTKAAKLGSDPAMIRLAAGGFAEIPASAGSPKPEPDHVGI